MFGARKGKKTKVFAVPLAESVLANRPNGSTIVADVVTDVLAYLEKHEFYKFEGIYRVPGRQSRLEALRESYDKGEWAAHASACTRSGRVRCGAREERFFRVVYADGQRTRVCRQAH